MPSDNKQIDLRRSIVDFRRALCLISLGADANVKLGPICLRRRRWTKMYVLKIGTRLLHPHTQQPGHFFEATRLDFTHASMSPLLNGEQEADDDDDASGRAASRNSLRKRFHWTTYLLT